MRALVSSCNGRLCGRAFGSLGSSGKGNIEIALSRLSLCCIRAFYTHYYSKYRSGDVVVQETSMAQLGNLGRCPGGLVCGLLPSFQGMEEGGRGAFILACWFFILGEHPQGSVSVVHRGYSYKERGIPSSLGWLSRILHFPMKLTFVPARQSFFFPFEGSF